MPSYGIVVEGSYDTPVLSCLTIRVDSPDARIFPIECGGIGALRKKLVSFLRVLERIDAGQPVDKVLVFADCDDRTPAHIEADLRTIIAPGQFRFPQGIEVCAVRRETETWLLADEHAISVVARAREGRGVPYIQGDLEEIRDAKARLRQVLTRAGLLYTPPVLREIGEAADLETLRYRLPSFRAFAGKV